MKTIARIIAFGVVFFAFAPTLRAVEAYIPHITTGYTDWTDSLVVDNNSDQDQSFTLTLFAEGTEAFRQVMTVQAQGQVVIDLKGLSAAAETGSVTYSNKALQFRVGYENVGGGVAEFPLPESLQSSLGLYFSDYVTSITSKGAALANLGPGTATATLYAVGTVSADPLDDGGVLASAEVSIGPYSKVIGVHTDFFPGVPFSQIKKIIAVSGSTTLCGLTICGDATLSHLLFTPALPVTGFDPVPVKSATDIFYIQDYYFHKNTLDVYYPEDADSARVLIFVPGGAWRQGDKNGYGEMARLFAAYYGYVVVVINYRLSNDTDGAAIHPDHVEDVASAFLWTKTHITDYGGSPSSIYVMGQSAGAHLAALLCTDTSYLTAVGCAIDDIRGVIVMSGSYSLNDLVVYPVNPMGLTAEEVLMYKYIFLDAFGGWDQATLDGASPILYVNDSQPAFMVINTEVDMPGFTLQGQRFVSAMTSKAIAVEHHGLTQSDYSSQTWEKATELAADEPAFEDYIGHYAEVVAINPNDRNSPPTTWIVNFINTH